jgi:N-acetylglucosamine-6-phosphate deacetylase
MKGFNKKMGGFLIIAPLFVCFPNTARSQQTIEGLSYIDGKPISVELVNGKIGNIKQIEKLSGENAKLYIAPGLIDNQENGYNGVGFSFGNDILTPEGIHRATRGLWERGVTTYLPTLVTNSREVLKNNFSTLAKAKDDDTLLGSVPGFHLEGTYISPEDGYRGAHSKKYVRKPDWNEFMELYQASGMNILTVTIAPELEGAMDFITKCTEMGIVVAIGHHNANALQINEAVKNGAKIGTHLGNGCANLINRHDNPIWPQLANDGLMISIICDGFHLRPEEIITFFKVKGVGNTIITSDITKFAGLEPGIYKNAVGDDLELTRDGKVQYPAQQVLAGAAMAINRGVAHVMKVTGCSLAEAIQMASTNPAKLYELNDRGTLEKGKRADLILFTIGDQELEIKKTYIKGKLVYDSSN